MNTPIYLDHHATTPVDPRVLDAMLPFFRENFGNAASIDHEHGRRAANAVKTAREQVAELAGVPAKAVIFTSGATEANNLALKGLLTKPGARLVTTAVEHPSVLDVADRMNRRSCEVDILPVDSTGAVDLDRLADALKKPATLVSVIHANNEVGTVNDLPAIAEICFTANLPLHTDAVQSFGKLETTLTAVPLVSVSAHKLYGPKGVGALLVNPRRGRLPLEPQIEGGGHERHLRSGTLPVPLIVGFGRACQLAAERLRQDTAHVKSLRDRLWSKLQAQLTGVTRHGSELNCLTGNLNVGFEGVDGDALLTGLTKIAVSSGSACTTADPEPSHVLRAMGVPDELSRASLRFGIGRENTTEEIDAAAEHVVNVVNQLREFR